MRVKLAWIPWRSQISATISVTLAWQVATRSFLSRDKEISASFLWKGKRLWTIIYSFQLMYAVRPCELRILLSKSTIFPPASRERVSMSLVVYGLYSHGNFSLNAKGVQTSQMFPFLYFRSSGFGGQMRRDVSRMCKGNWGHQGTALEIRASVLTEDKTCWITLQ